MRRPRSWQTQDLHIFPKTSLTRKWIALSSLSKCGVWDPGVHMFSEKQPLSDDRFWVEPGSCGSKDNLRRLFWERDSDGCCGKAGVHVFQSGGGRWFAPQKADIIYSLSCLPSPCPLARPPHPKPGGTQWCSWECTVVLDALQWWDIFRISHYFIKDKHNGCFTLTYWGMYKKDIIASIHSTSSVYL